MSREHRRPLFAFVFVTFLCMLVVGNSMTLASGANRTLVAEVRAAIAGDPDDLSIASGPIAGGVIASEDAAPGVIPPAIADLFAPEAQNDTQLGPQVPESSGSFLGGLAPPATSAPQGPSGPLPSSSPSPSGESPSSPPSSEESTPPSNDPPKQEETPPPTEETTPQAEPEPTPEPTAPEPEPAPPAEPEPDGVLTVDIITTPPPPPPPVEEPKPSDTGTTDTSSQTASDSSTASTATE